MFYYFYLLVLGIAYIFLLPFLLFFSFTKKYRFSIPSRFFLINNSPLKKDGIHFHVCSYGEAKALKPIIKNIDSSLLRFSAITNTGFSAVSEYSKNSRYLPFEIFLPFWIKNQKVLVVLEAELWYMLFKVSKSKGAKTFLVNARITQKSYPKYKRFKWLYSHIFKNIDSIYAQTYEDARRLIALGAKNVKVCGNIKFANITKANKNFPKNYNLIITAGSTHEGEEELIFNAYKELKKIENTQLIVVPRHPERFNKIATFLQKEAQKSSLSFSKYSQNKEFKTDIVLIDKMGELINAYKISDIVILGGAFADIGGHNAIEAAQFGCKIITGKNFYNQKEIFNQIEGLTIIEANQLNEKLINYSTLPNTKVDIKYNLDELIKEIIEALR